MFILRRTAARAISQQQPTRQLSTLRPASRVTLLAKPTLYRPFHQSRIWLAEGEQQKPSADQAEASPAEATTSGETVTTEPSQAEEQIKSESIATPDVTDAAAQEPSSSEHSTPAAHDAVSESSGTTAEPLGHSEAPAPAAQTPEPTSFAESAQDLVAKTAQTARSAGRAARDAFDTTAASNQGSSSRTAEFPPRQPASRDAASGPRGGDTPAQPSRILYIGNLFFEVTAPQLETEFAKFGEIANSRVVTDSRGLSKGFGYVEFATQEAADQAVRELDQKVFQGRRMAVQFHVRREPRAGSYSGGSGGGERGMGGRGSNPPSKTLFIGNMSYQMSDRDLNDMFREIRNVLDVRVAIDRRSGQPRGFAHADFIDVASAETAKEFLEKKVVYGRQLRVDFSASSSSSTQTAAQ